MTTTQRDARVVEAAEAAARAALPLAGGVTRTGPAWEAGEAGSAFPAVEAPVLRAAVAAAEPVVTRTEEATNPPRNAKKVTN